MAAMQQLSRVFVRHRPRLARLTLILGLVLGFRVLAAQWPRETQLEFELGADHRDVIELRVTYLDHGQELHGVSFPFPEGAPPRVRHHLTLPPGDLLLHCELRARDGGLRALTRKLHAPAAGVVRIALADSTDGGRS